MRLGLRVCERKVDKKRVDGVKVFWSSLYDENKDRRMAGKHR